MKRLAGITAALGLFGIVLAGRLSNMHTGTEKPLPVITEPAAMLAPVNGAPARPAHTELASFAAG